MIIAVPTNDKKTVSDVFGRAGFFALYDTEKKEITYLDNSANAALPGGAGINAGSMLLENNISKIVTIDFGPKAKDVMKDKPVERFERLSPTL